MMTTPLEPQPQYRLALRHECRWISCTDMDCPLCVQSSDRCFHNFSTSQIVRSVKRNDKISAGACVFKADCGAPISLTIIKMDGSQVEPLPRLKIQFTLVEYTENLERHLNGVDFPAARDVVGSIVPMQLGIRQLLKASTQGGQEAYDEEEQLVLPFEPLDHPHPSQPRNQVFSKPVNVYVDTPLRDIVNRHSERVKRVGLLVRAVGLEDKILPALSTPFMLYTRRRDAKDTIPRPSDRVRDLSDMSDATCARLINLRQSAKDQGDVGVPLEQLPDEPISTAGQMYDFLEGKSEDFLAVVSMKVLKRPKDCLLNLRKELDSKMIKMENDTRPRVWKDEKDSEGKCLLYAAYKGVCVLDYTPTNPSVFDKEWNFVSTTSGDWERRQKHNLAVMAWHQPGHPGWSFDPRRNPPGKFASAAAAAAPPAPTWSKAPQPQAASTGQAQPPQAGISPLALLGGLPGGFSYPGGGWPRSLPQASGLQGQAAMSMALATAMSSQPHLRQMMQNLYPPGGTGRPPGLQSQPGSGVATSVPSSGSSLVPPYLQGFSFTGLSAPSTSSQTGNLLLGAPPALPNTLGKSTTTPQSTAASPSPAPGSGAPAAAPSMPRTYTYLVKVFLAVPEASTEWKGQVKLVFRPDADGVGPSFSPESRALELSPKFRFGSAPQAIDFILQLQFPRGSVVLEKTGGTAPCWVWLDSIEMTSVPAPASTLVHRFDVQAGCDLARTKICMAKGPPSPNQEGTAFTLSRVEEGQQLLDAFEDAVGYVEGLRLEAGVPGSILECQRQALLKAISKETASSDKWKSKLFFTLREAGSSVELEVRLHERKSGLTTFPVRLKTPPTSINSTGNGTMFCASVDLPGNFEPDVLLLKLTAATLAVKNGMHLLASLRLEAHLQKGFVRLYDFSSPHRTGELWVSLCDNRTKALPLSEKIADKDYAELAVEKAKPMPQRTQQEPRARMGTLQTPWSTWPPDQSMDRPGPGMQQRAPGDSRAMPPLSAKGNATWPGNKGSIAGGSAAGQGYLRAQNQPSLAPPKTSGGIGQQPGFPQRNAASPFWQEPWAGSQPMQLSPQEMAARGAGRAPGGSQPPITLPGRPLGTGRASAAPPRQLTTTPQSPATPGESMLQPSDSATAAFKKVAGILAAVLEDIAKLPTTLLPAEVKGEAESKSLTQILARLQRQLTSDLAAPVAELLKEVQLLAKSPEYRCVIVGQPRSGKSTVLAAFKDISLASTSQKGASSTPTKKLAEGVHEHEAMVTGVSLRLVDTPGHLGGPSSDTRQELQDQLQAASAVFLVLDYNSLDASLEWGQEQLAWQKLGDRLHVVVNKVEDTSLISSCETELEAAKRVRQHLSVCGLPVPLNQVWLLSASEARLCMSIRLRQAGLLRQVGNVQDKLFRLMVWGRKAPAAISDVDFTREVEAAFAKSGLGRLSRESVAVLHKRTGSQQLMNALHCAEALLARVRNTLLVSEATLQMASNLPAESDQDPDKADRFQPQQPCLLPELVVKSLTGSVAWTHSSMQKEISLRVAPLQPLTTFTRELKTSHRLKELVEAAKQFQGGVEASGDASKYQQDLLDFLKSEVTGLVDRLQQYEPVSQWTRNDSKRHALHCNLWVRDQLRARGLAGTENGMQSHDQAGLIRKVTEAVIGEDLLDGLLQQAPADPESVSSPQAAWQEVLEEARRDLQNNLQRILTRQPEGMQEYVSELAKHWRSLPESERAGWAKLGMKPLQDMEMRLAAVKDDVISFQSSPLSSIATFAQHSQPKQQQYLGGQPRPPLAPPASSAFIPPSKPAGKRFRGEESGQPAEQVGAAPKPPVKRRKTEAALSSFSAAGKDPNKGQKACVQCGTKSTPVWRSGPAGPKTLCNACGVSHKRGEDSQKKEQLKHARTSSRIQGMESGSTSRASPRQSSEQNPPRKGTARQSKMELNKAKAGGKRMESEKDVAEALMGLRAGDSHGSGPSHAAEDTHVLFYGRKKKIPAATTPDIREEDSESGNTASFDSVDDSGSEATPSGTAMQEGNEMPQGGSRGMSDLNLLLEAADQDEGATLLPARESMEVDMLAQLGSKAASPQRCAECKTTTTPVWRSGPQGPKTLCNDCGVKHKTNISNRMDISGSHQRTSV